MYPQYSLGRWIPGQCSLVRFGWYSLSWMSGQLGWYSRSATWYGGRPLKNAWNWISFANNGNAPFVSRLLLPTSAHFQIQRAITLYSKQIRVGQIWKSEFRRACFKLSLWTLVVPCLIQALLSLTFQAFRNLTFEALRKSTASKLFSV